MPKLSFRDWPIVENLPNFIRSKWEKRVVQYAEDHNDAYSGFKEFAAIIQEQARLKNHSNVLACPKRILTQTEEFSNQVWKAETLRKRMPKKRNSVPSISLRDTF